jgi:hypothetical protein
VIEARHPKIKWAEDPFTRSLQRRAMVVKEYLIEHPEESARVDSRRYTPPPEGFGKRGPDASRNLPKSKANDVLAYAAGVNLGEDDDRWRGIEATAPPSVRASIQAGQREPRSFSRDALRKGSGAQASSDTGEN